MEFVCRHCEEIAFGQPYRVISEQDGIVLLDMIVCRRCYEQAQDLGLHSEPVPVSSPLGRHPEQHRVRSLRRASA